MLNLPLYRHRLSRFVWSDSENREAAGLPEVHMSAWRHVIVKGGQRETLFCHCVCGACRKTTSSSILAEAIISRTMASDSGKENSSNEEDLPPEYYQEDALDYDCYGDENEEGPCETSEQKLQTLQQLDDKAHCSRKLEEVYPNSGITTSEKLEQKIEEFEQLKKEPEYKEFCESENSFNGTKEQVEDCQDEPEQ